MPSSPMIRMFRKRLRVPTLPPIAAALQKFHQVDAGCEEGGKYAEQHTRQHRRDQSKDQDPGIDRGLIHPRNVSRIQA